MGNVRSKKNRLNKNLFTSFDELAFVAYVQTTAL